MGRGWCTLINNNLVVLKDKWIEEHKFVRKIAITNMAKTKPDSRLYALLHPDMGKWGWGAVPQSTAF